MLPSSGQAFLVGVGCFHFSMKWHDGLTLSNFKKQLLEGLNGISNISNVEIDGPLGFATHPFGTSIISLNDPDADTSVPPFGAEITDGPGVCPYLVDARISFEIFLPHRIQQQLWGSLKNTNERFLIQIFYDMRFPVALVSPMDAGCEDATDAVVVVRKFLESQFEQSGKAIQFESLGPSPFHAHITVQATERDETIVVSSEIDSYSKINAALVLPDNPSSEDVQLALYQKIGRELSLYYAVVQCRNYGLSLRADLDEALHKVRAAFRSSSTLPDIIATFRMSKPYHEAVLTKFDLEIGKMELDEALGRVEKSFLQAGHRLQLKDIIEEEVRDYPVAGLQIAEGLLRSIDSRRQEISRNWSSILSAFVGALLGFVLAHLLAASTQVGAKDLSYPRSSAASLTGSGASVSAGLSPQFAGYVRASR